MNRNKLIIFASPVISLFIALTAQAQISGTYNGQIESSGLYVPVTATFSMDKNSQINGRYEYRENGRRYPGTLTDCTYNGSVNVRCYWRDAAGNGTVTFAFDNTFKQFVGLWSSDEGEEWYGWSGEKKRLSTNKTDMSKVK